MSEYYAEGNLKKQGIECVDAHRISGLILRIQVSKFGYVNRRYAIPSELAVDEALMKVLGHCEVSRWNGALQSLLEE